MNFLGEKKKIRKLIQKYVCVCVGGQSLKLQRSFCFWKPQTKRVYLNWYFMSQEPVPKVI